MLRERSVWNYHKQDWDSTDCELANLGIDGEARVECVCSHSVSSASTSFAVQFGTENIIYVLETANVKHLSNPEDLALLFSENPTALIFICVVSVLFFLAGRLAQKRDRVLLSARNIERLRKGSKFVERDLEAHLRRIKDNGAYALMQSSLLSWCVSMLLLSWGFSSTVALTTTDISGSWVARMVGGFSGLIYASTSIASAYGAFMATHPPKNMQWTSVRDRYHKITYGHLAAGGAGAVAAMLNSCVVLFIVLSATSFRSVFRNILPQTTQHCVAIYSGCCTPKCLIARVTDCEFNGAPPNCTADICSTVELDDACAETIYQRLTYHFWLVPVIIMAVSAWSFVAMIQAWRNVPKVAIRAQPPPPPKLKKGGTWRNNKMDATSWRTLQEKEHENRKKSTFSQIKRGFVSRMAMNFGTAGVQKLLQREEAVDGRRPLLVVMLEDHCVTGLFCAPLSKIERISTAKRVLFLWVDVLGCVAASVLFMPSTEEAKLASGTFVGIFTQSVLGSFFAHIPAQLSLILFNIAHSNFYLGGSLKDEKRVRKGKLQAAGGYCWIFTLALTFIYFILSYSVTIPRADTEHWLTSFTTTFVITIMLISPLFIVARTMLTRLFRNKYIVGLLAMASAMLFSATGGDQLEGGVQNDAFNEATNVIERDSVHAATLIDANALEEIGASVAASDGGAQTGNEVQFSTNDVSAQATEGSITTSSVEGMVDTEGIAKDSTNDAQGSESSGVGGPTRRESVEVETEVIVGLTAAPLRGVQARTDDENIIKKESEEILVRKVTNDAALNFQRIYRGFAARKVLMDDPVPQDVAFEGEERYQTLVEDVVRFLDTESGEFYYMDRRDGRVVWFDPLEAAATRIQAYYRGNRGRVVAKAVATEARIVWEESVCVVGQRALRLLAAIESQSTEVVQKLAKLEIQNEALEKFEAQLLQSRETTNIAVAVRFRPLNARERRKSISERVPKLRIATPSLQVLSISTETPDAKKRDYAFDFVFGSNTNQTTVYETCALPYVQAFLGGYNTTIFAYGQTGSGKTWTMFGRPNESPELAGVIPRACSMIFEEGKKKRGSLRTARQRSKRRSILFSIAGANRRDSVSPESTEDFVVVSFLQIYNEVVMDLLKQQGGKDRALKIIQGKTSDEPMMVEGAIERQVSCTEDLERLLLDGEQNRKVSATKMNANSSRSHTVLIVKRTATVVDRYSKLSRRTRAQLCIIDLAGCERSSKTGATGATLREANNINNSLTTLGTCISMLSKKKTGHVPFRNSKLTRLLQGSLGGNCRTLLLLACGPHASNYSETLSTLEFGQRAKHVKTTSTLQATLTEHSSPDDMNEAQRALSATLGKLNTHKAKVGEIRSQIEALDDTKQSKAKLQSLEEGLKVREALVFVDMLSKDRF